MTRLRQPAIVLGLVALALRLAWALTANVQHGPRLQYPDEELHWQIATHLARDGEFRTDDGRQAARMPLYPLLLAPLAALGASGVAFARVAQALLSALAVAVGVRLADRAFGRGAAWLAGVLLAFDPYSIFFSALLLTETPFVLAAMLLIALGWRLWVAGASKDETEPPRNLSLLVGLAAAATLMIRQSAVGWIALFLLVIALAHRDKWLGLSRFVGQALIVALAMAPWGLRNMAVVGEFAWLSANGGVTLYDAQGPQADGSSDQSFLAAMPELHDLTEMEQDALLSRYALDAMKADKARVALLAWKKLARMWNPAPNAEGHNAGLTAWVSSIYTLVVVALALAGWASAERRRAARGGEPALAAVRFLLLPVLLFTLLHCLYIGSVRYRVPLMPMLAVAGAAVVTRASVTAPAHSRHT
ncbi:MAG: glycosyltransferase family 39 protein [Phycisphaerales bacterium]|nr:glycosyltransferase family 39 protein [Phycisphaerales bacterium]